MRSRFYLLFLLICGCSPRLHSALEYDTIVTQNLLGYETRLYYKGEQLLFVVSAEDSAVILYQGESNLVLKTTVYDRSSKIISVCHNYHDPNGAYDVLVCDDSSRTLQEPDGYGFGILINTYDYLANDFKYVSALLSDTIYSSLQSVSDTSLSLSLNTGVGQLQRSIYSPFIEGRTITQLNLEISDRLLSGYSATFYDSLNRYEVRYRRIIRYDKKNRVLLLQSINLADSSVESEEKFSYRAIGK